MQRPTGTGRTGSTRLSKFTRFRIRVHLGRRRNSPFSLRLINGDVFGIFGGFYLLGMPLLLALLLALQSHRLLALLALCR